MEIHAFLGVLYLRGVLRQNLHSRELIWYHESSNDVFAATMSEKRFAFLSTAISFDDKETRATQPVTLRLTKHCTLIGEELG